LVCYETITSLFTFSWFKRLFFKIWWSKRLYN